LRAKIGIYILRLTAGALAVFEHLVLIRIFALPKPPGIFMEIAKTYDPSLTEDKWYQHWMNKGFFHSEPDHREPYTIVIPPPNVTGVLHMGHMLNNTIQDVMIRRARMLGKNACWVPGTDHASIATEAKVVAMLREQGIHKSELTRDQFLQHAWEWKEKYGGIILDQLKKLGASCDWERTRFTMEEDLSDAVIEVFIDLHKKGYIYRGTRMVNWDPAGLTAVSDEEVIHKEVDSTLYHVRYKVKDADEYITIATTRPETILGDTAICVHPGDERYKHLHGKTIIVPLVNREVPLITDSYVTMEFGTGALKVTPAHDINDYALGQKHNLKTIDILTPDGKLNASAEFYIGVDRFEARKKIAVDLAEKGALIKTEAYKSNIGFSERTNAVIEPRLSMQWFLKMDEISRPALENVMNDNIKLVPEKFKNTYRHWMENVHDWCISRQLWWGQRIPAWYNGDGEYVVAKTYKEATFIFSELNKEREAAGMPMWSMSDIKQDEDVLDTWFSSWLWPISVFDGFKDPGNADINYYYPTNDLVTAPEILFFWVARMIIAGYEYRGEKPFSNVYLTGIVRDKQGRKMSKSLGNSPDPLDLIEKYGADGVRVGMLFSSPAGNDLPFDESLCEQGRNFANKIWNAFRLVNNWKESDVKVKVDLRDYTAVTEWFSVKLSSEISIINDLFSKYRISEALMAIYKLVWDDFCSWYLEIVKPGIDEAMTRELYATTSEFLESLLKLLHPFMPFITEEIWHSLKERKDTDCIIVAQWPSPKGEKTEILDEFSAAMELVTQIRNIRKSKNISMREPLMVTYKNDSAISYSRFFPMVIKLCNLSSFEESFITSEEITTIVVRNNEYYIHTAGLVNNEVERSRLLSELEYTRSFLNSVLKKLENEKFVNNAKPEILALEKKKKSDSEAKIHLLEKQLSLLKPF
jgi:valyl-tRNA synthetase